MKLLVVEDDAETADYVAQGLRELGHGVEVAGNGRDGLFFATEGTYDLLVVDRRLDGLTLVKTSWGAGIRVATWKMDLVRWRFSASRPSLCSASCTGKLLGIWNSSYAM